MYVLGGEDGHTPISCADALEWANWMEKADRKVAATVVGNLEVSTVFLGLNHNHFSELLGPRKLRDRAPLLFETMIFELAEEEEGDRHSIGYQTRCSTWDEAVSMHEEGVAAARRSLLKLVEN